MLEVSSSHLDALQQQGGDTIDGKASKSKGDGGKNQIRWNYLFATYQN